MNSISFIHTADLHLDAAGAGVRRGKEWSEKRKKDRFHTLTKIVDLCIDKNVNFLLIAGDLYEHKSVRPSTIQFIHNQFSRIPDVNIIITPGNHDPYVINSFYHIHEWPQNVYIFTPDIIKYEFPQYRLSIQGQAFNNFEVRENRISTLRAKEGYRNIFLLHGALTFSEQMESPHMPFTIKDIKALNGDYIGLGHYHNPQNVLQDDKRLRAYYCGTPEPLSMDEQGSRSVLYGILNASGFQYEIIPVSQMEYHQINFVVDNVASDEELMRDLLSLLMDYQPAANKAFFVYLEGWRNIPLPFDIFTIEKQLHKEFPYIDIEDKSRPYYDLEALEMESSIAGQFVRRMKEKMRLTKDEKQKNVILGGIYLGLDALIHKEVKKTYD